jgi:hypothetical protein
MTGRGILKGRSESGIKGCDISVKVENVRDENENEWVDNLNE